MSVIQKEGEYVTSYIQSFHEEVLSILGAIDATMVPAFINGIRTPKLKWKLLEQDISTYAEAMDIVQRFIRASDICTPIDFKKKNDTAGRLKERTPYWRNSDTFVWERSLVIKAED